MKKKPLFVELFCGQASMCDAMESLGWAVLGIDINPNSNAHMIADVLDLDDDFLRDLNPTFVWAGVDCSCFSIMSVSRYWITENEPNEDNWGIHLLRKTVRMIERATPLFWAIENPRGMMRKQPELMPYARYQIAYCQYGDDIMKPTDLFGFLPPTFYPRMCRNENPMCDHIRSPRGSRTGLQGRPRSTRSIYPAELVREISESVNSWVRTPPDWAFGFEDF